MRFGFSLGRGKKSQATQGEEKRIGGGALGLNGRQNAHKRKKLESTQARNRSIAVREASRPRWGHCEPRKGQEQKQPEKPYPEVGVQVG